MIKNIVYIYDQAYLSGGAAKIVIGEALEMKRRGYQCIFFAGVGPISPELTDAGIDVICLNEEHIAFTKNPVALLKGIFNYNAYKKLKYVLMRLNPSHTIVHVHGWSKSLSSSVFLAAYKKNFKVYVTLHEYFTVCQNGGLYNYKEKRICDKKPGSLRCMFCNCDKRNYLHKIYRNMRQITQNIVLKIAKPIPIYITKFSERFIMPYFPYATSSFVLTNHVEIAADKERVHVEDNDTYLFIGRISDEKGIDLFCEAITSLNKKGIVIGSSPHLEIYKKMYTQIEFVGWKHSDEMRPYLEEARCLIISSKWYETMGLTIVEMQQYGIPCIVPNQCAGMEYIKDKISGLAYQIGNLNSLLSAIKLSEDDTELRHMSQSFYESLNILEYSLENHCNQLINIYQKEINV